MTFQQKGTLAAISSIAIIMLFGGYALLDEGKISADIYLWVQAGAVFVGFFAVAGAFEKKFGPSLSEFKVSGLWWAALLAIWGYLARVYAVDEVNNIFHVDPAALPLTVIAATVMRIFIWMQVPFLIVAVGSLMPLILVCRGTYFPERTEDAEKVATVILMLSSMVICSVSAIAVYSQLDENGRKQKLYRTAHATDFVSKFNCLGIDQGKYSVLFLGPEQRRVLVAPHLPEASLFQRPSPEFLQKLTVPSNFPIVDCQPAMTLEQWEQQTK